ncbi:NAD(P)/FAD-dependent oxidoreductase [Oscillospiraceae bacterium CM]|nr:NAD(P)/FAD-dependent oxidoreductase [Oscillospiraceae bacterium CM]
MAEKTAIIIGAGPAGLTAAYMLLRDTDIRPIILEETPFIGGISRTAAFNGNRIDLGGHRFFSKNEDVMTLWRELMPVQGAPAYDDKMLSRQKDFFPDGPDPEKTDRVLLLRDRVSRIFYLRRFFDYPITLKAQTLLNMGLLRTLRAGFGYLHAALFKRREKTLEDFYINRFGKPLYTMFFEDYTEKVWGVHPSRIAPDWGAQRVRGLSLSKAVLNMLRRPFARNNNQRIETSLIESFYYPKKGPGQLWEALAERVVSLGGTIHLSTKAASFAVENSKVAAVTAVKDGETSVFRGDYVLSSMPVRDLVANMGGDVPADVRAIAEGLPYRDFMTAGLLVKQLEIQNETRFKTLANIVPDCWIYVQEREVQLGRMQIFNNWSPYMVKDPENTVFIGLEYFCNAGDAMWTMTDRAFCDFAAFELEKIGVIRRENILDSVCIRVPKAYPAYFGTYEAFSDVRRYLDTVSNLYCIGRNGQHKYNNMDHSMLTAMEAVRCIREGKTSKNDVWNVNTESDYHEAKAE